MAELLSEFDRSGDAGWDITEEYTETLVNTYEMLPAYPDILVVFNKSSIYLLRRSCIGKPKILNPSANGGIDDNSSA